MPHLWNRLGLQARLQILIQSFLIIVLLSAQQWLTFKFESEILTAAQNRAHAVADSLINGLNTLMVTKFKGKDIISEKHVSTKFIKSMGIAENIKELRVIRDKSVDIEYPDGILASKQPVDDLDRTVLHSGTPQYQLLNMDSDPSVRAVLPFMASKNYNSINCLRCHDIKEGGVLGATSITIDIKNDWATIQQFKTRIWIGQFVLQIVLFFVIAWIARRLLRQLGGEPTYVIDIVKQIAKGDLSDDIQVRSGDHHSLLAATKEMQNGLRTLVGASSESAEKLIQSARQLADSAHQVMQTAEHQNKASESIAASVEQMSASIFQISESATGAQQHVSETGTLAKEGAGAVQQVIKEMEQISASVSESSRQITLLGDQSNQISNIVKVIRDIAEQTNLLALNAAIEAARAGDQGRGFAVVANEVKNLADRTSASTLEIHSMIQNIQSGTSAAVSGMSQGNERVLHGVQVVNAAGNSMEIIQRGVQQVLDSINEISGALREQTSTNNHITQEMEEITQMSEQTCAIIRNVSGSANHLQQLAENLQESVGRFILKNAVGQK